MLQRSRRFRLELVGMFGGGFRVGVGQNRSPAPPDGSLLPGIGHVLVVDLTRIARAGHDLLHPRQGVPVGGQETQVVTAGYLVPAGDRVIAGCVGSSFPWRLPI